MGPKLRTDVVDVYVVRRGKAGVEFLQLHRAKEPLIKTWQPVMGHAEAGETAEQAARREIREETGLEVDVLHALEQVHPFFLPERDEILLSPRFWVEVGPEWVPTLNFEHDAARWVTEADIRTAFHWPGQRACCREILEELGLR